MYNLTQMVHLPDIFTSATDFRPPFDFNGDCVKNKRFGILFSPESNYLLQGHFPEEIYRITNRLIHELSLRINKCTLYTNMYAVPPLSMDGLCTVSNYLCTGSCKIRPLGIYGKYLCVNYDWCKTKQCWLIYQFPNR